MREDFKLKGKLHRVKNVEEGIRLVREIYPSVVMEGSLCHYTFFTDLYNKEKEKIVGECWMTKKKDWKVRILLETETD